MDLKYGHYRWPRRLTVTAYLVVLVLLHCIGGRRHVDAEVIPNVNTEEPKLEVPADYFIKVGDPCSPDHDACSSIRGGICDESTRQCACKDTHPINEMGNLCFEPARLNHSCEVDSQCEYVNRNSFCAKPKRVCQCSPRYPQVFSQNGTAYCYIDRRQLADTEVDYTMLGVLAGMALMFIIMCIVLRMFSKARFQEQRTIFNDPQMLKGSLARKTRERIQSDRRGSKSNSRAPSRQPSLYSGLNVPIKSPTHSQGSLKDNNGSGGGGTDSRHSSFGSPRNADDVIVDIRSGGQTTAAASATQKTSSPKINRV